MKAARAKGLITPTGATRKRKADFQQKPCCPEGRGMTQITAGKSLCFQDDTPRKTKAEDGPPADPPYQKHRGRARKLQGEERPGPHTAGRHWQMPRQVRRSAHSVLLMDALQDQRSCTERYLTVMFRTYVDVKHGNTRGHRRRTCPGAQCVTAWN